MCLQLVGDLPTDADFKRKAAEERRRLERQASAPFAEDELLQRPEAFDPKRQAVRTYSPTAQRRQRRLTDAT